MASLEDYVESPCEAVFGDRYSQASTYCGLGVIAEQLEDYEQARHNYQQSLEIYLEFNDAHNSTFALRGFARSYQTTEDKSLLTEVAQYLNSTVEEVAQKFDVLNNNSA
ncbi:tetratricopeptide repeat protein [cf. Phormidesmis sp. LEGE 11477]|uniref:tetratricopeptide repeat protein n=1 Tax=cf. Phormidesmis sp. LEGE 11477 TaxID=1828680 RepID=UPI0018829FB9|nr:tetratricopeptide repeat protein [cf. Phormidesmis sp. LEGE 11477]